MNIKDVHRYFGKFDSIKQDSIIDKDELIQAKQENSIFSSILRENITFEEYCVEFVRTYKDKLDILDYTNGIYKMEKMPDVQPWAWQEITKVLTKDEVNAAPYNISTKEGAAINSNINFNNSDGEYMLAYLSFDKETFKNTPTENLPDGWNPNKIIEDGMDPGMNVRKMQAMGYTGKGVTCAVIDTPIIKHAEITDNLVGYETMDESLAYNQSADFHGQATSGILCGKQTGVAKDSKLVYFAETSDNDKLQALRRVLEINKAAEENGEPEKKIRVVSLSWGYNKGDGAYNEYCELLKQLYADGVFVATADFNMIDENITGCTMARNVLKKKVQTAEQNDYENYVAENDVPGYPERSLCVLSGDRTVASATDQNAYRHDSQSSTSWSVPALAGIYACALQCAEQNNVEFSPAIFWDYALKTGVEAKDENGNILGKAIDAESLVKYIEQEAKNSKQFGI